MLRIRQEQFQAIRTHSRIQFEREMVQHLGTFAPRLFEIRGEPAFSQLVHSGIQTAAGYGFTNRGPIRFYLETMVALGSEFDTDPQLQDVIRTLGQTDEADQMKRADQLFQDVSRFLEKTKGPKNRYAIQALERLRLLKRYPPAGSPESLQSELIERMQRTYPQKCLTVGEEPLRILIDSASNQARRALDVNTPAGISMLTALMFALGHGVMRDPLYPWVAQTLTDPVYGDPTQRIERLYRRANTYLDATLDYLAA